jgi:hypothetical protein
MNVIYISNSGWRVCDKVLLAMKKKLHFNKFPKFVSKIN